MNTHLNEINPAFMLATRQGLSTTEAAVYTGMSYPMFCRQRKLTGVVPYQMGRTHMYLPKDLETLLVYNIFQTMCTDKLRPEEGDAGISMDEFVGYHYGFNQTRFNHIKTATFDRLFLRAVKKYRVIYPSLLPSSLN